MTLYLAYASNLCHLQMEKRCPNSTFIGLFKLDDWELFFMSLGYASVREAKGKSTIAALYKLTPECEASLDMQERVDEEIYQKHYLEYDNKDHLIYIAKDTKTGLPYQDYKHRIIAGLKHREAPDQYINHVINIKDSGTNSPIKDYSDEGGGFNRQNP